MILNGLLSVVLGVLLFVFPGAGVVGVAWVIGIYAIIAGIMEMMTLGKFRHLPVVEDDRVVGLISIGDIVKWRVREFEMEQEALRDYIKTA